MVGSALFAFISIPEGDDTLAVPVFQGSEGAWQCKECSGCHRGSVQGSVPWAGHTRLGYGARGQGLGWGGSAG